MKKMVFGKISRKILAILLVGAMTVAMAGCGNNAGQAVEGKHCKIGIALYSDQGMAAEALKAYLGSLSETLNVEFVYAVMSVNDEAYNLTKIQEMIAAGVDGIITTMDPGTTPVVAECEAAGVYLGGYICDFDTSYTQAYDQVFTNKYFVGTSSDGQTSDNITAGTTMFESLIEYNERNVDAPLTHVSLVIFPIWAYPTQTVAAQQFIAAVDEYNKTAATPITVDPLNEETDVLPFSPLDSTYFAKHEGIQGIISFAAGSGFVYPTMVSAGVDSSLKLFTTGFDGGEEVNFGTAGKGTYQQNMVTAVESVTFSLVLLLNKINGVDFPDQPAAAERISTTQYIMNSDEDMAKFQKTIYYTANVADAMFTPQDVINMTAYGNPEATYAGLKEILSQMTIDNIK